MSIGKLYQDFIYTRTYSRWDWDKGRREHWDETVSRYTNYLLPRIPETFQGEFIKAGNMIHDLEIMPSMRVLWSAGPALDNCNVAAYNCAYTKIDRIRVFSEILYILMQGAGIGFSVERQYITDLPPVPDNFQESEETLIFEDSKKGWAEGFGLYLQGLFNGIHYKYDLSKIRPEGQVLKTFGGRASGPAPLQDLLKFSYHLLKAARGRKLNSLECHELVCYISSIVVVGGVRRSSAISLSNLSDQRMQYAKMGNFGDAKPYLYLANNSVAYTELPDMHIFMEEWTRLMMSGTGERGIFNRKAAEAIVRLNGRRQHSSDWGTNPCSEIILRPEEFCNLSEIVVRKEDNLGSLMEKVKYATILGMVQSTLTDFKYIDERWKKNCEEERLIGVSLTGVMDHPVLSNMTKRYKIEEWLSTLKEEVLRVAKMWSKILDIPMPAATTCVKPSGTVSQRVNSASGLHPRHSPYYIRRVRVSSVDPLSKFLIDRKVPHNPENGDNQETPKTWVFDFPISAPKKAVCREDISAIEQLEHWKLIQQHWCEHKPSITVYVKEHEWLKVASWVYDNWEWVSGISFLPYDGGLYKLAPYEEITSDQYKALLKTFPKDIDFSELIKYEQDDYTTGSRELACSSAEGCEL